DCSAVFYNVGYDVLAEIVARIRVTRVTSQLVEKELRVEDIDTHTRKRFIRLSRHWRRISGLLKEGANNIILVDVDNPEGARFIGRDFETGNRDVSLLTDVLLQHHLVIHLVDVITGKQHDISAAMALDDIDVLVYRVRCSEVPHRFGDSLARRKDVETFVALWAKEIPTHLKMPDEAMGLILGRNSDTTNPRVQSVRK